MTFDYLNKTYPISKDYIKDMFTEITRHIVFHDCFDEIIIEKNIACLSYDIECFCGKSWRIASSDLIHCDVEAKEVVNFIEYFNTPAFHSQLKTIKEEGYYKTLNQNVLEEKTKSPTISSLEI